jgi:nucleoside-diphosphate-sugar epimerase
MRRLKGLEAVISANYFSDDERVNSFVQRIKPEVVIHTACSYGRNGESCVQLVDSNIRLGVVVADSLLHTGHPVTIINAGTCLSPTVSMYALSKFQFAQWGRAIATQAGSAVRFVDILLQHYYGPGNGPTNFISHVISSCRNNVPSLELTEGTQERDFIYIQDVVSAVAMIAERHSQLESVATFEVGSGTSSTIRHTVETIHRLTHSTTQLRFGVINYRTNEPMLCRANLDAISQLGWKPTYDLETGLQETLALEIKE